MAKISINRELTDAIILARSIRQGCPLAPLLFAISSDALGWLIKDCMSKGHIKGLSIPRIKKIYVCNSLHMTLLVCLEMMMIQLDIFGILYLCTVKLAALPSIMKKQISKQVTVVFL